jgi:LysR family transcriptional regulator, benzoate and cis,cis-muconate-responsive activator of ben and cat genes
MQKAAARMGRGFDSPIGTQAPGHSRMTLDSRQLECFIAVAEELNLNRAAARLHMTQPPLTRRIKQLEQDLRVRLFRRTAGGVELTEPGRTLLEQSYRIVALSHHAVDRTRLAAVGEVGRLAVGFYDTAILEGIPSLLRRFAELHPNVVIGLERVHRAAQIDHLRDGLLNVGFGENYGEENGITIRTVDREQLFVAYTDPLNFEDREAVTVAELKNLPVILYPSTRPGFADAVIDMFVRAGVAPLVAVEAEDVIACLAHVAIGAGIAVVPRSATHVRPSGVRFKPMSRTEHLRVSCVYLSSDHSPALTRFIEYLDTRDSEAG